MKNRIMAATFAALAVTFASTNFAHATGENADKVIHVFKTPTCGCCQVWVDAMTDAGYTVLAEDMADLSLIKKEANVTEPLQACHTSIIGEDRKYILEGHVPVEAVEKLMSEKPDIRGIAVPGMPMGSLGMGYDPDARYTVYAFTEMKDAEPAVFFEAGQ